MNTERKMKLKMYLAVRILLRANPAILAKLPNAEEFLTALDVAILDIQTYNALKDEGTKESKDEYKKAKAALILAIVDYAGKLTGYASYKEDKLLLALCKKTAKTLDLMDDQDLRQHGKTLLDKIALWIKELEKYYLTAATQANLQQLIADFEQKSPELKKATSDLGQTRQSVDDSFAKADAIMLKLDNEMEIIKVSDSAFVQQYKELRKVVVNYNTNDVVGHILDSVTGAGVPNATITLQLNDSTAASIVKTSAEKGGFQIKTITPGIYTVTVTKIGYITQTISLTITGDDQLSFDVRLVKSPNA